MAMQRNYFTVLFFLKKSKLLKNGEAPICMRITINGKRAEVQIKRSIDVTKWNTQKECAIGREKKYQEINHYLLYLDEPCGKYLFPLLYHFSTASNYHIGTACTYIGCQRA